MPLTLLAICYFLRYVSGMKRTVKYSVQALKTLARMQPKLRQRIEAAVDAYAENPAAVRNVKKLKGRNELRIRLGNWRIIITDDGLVVAVARIRPRGSAYKK